VSRSRVTQAAACSWQPPLVSRSRVTQAATCSWQPPLGVSWNGRLRPHTPPAIAHTPTPHTQPSSHPWPTPHAPRPQHMDHNTVHPMYILPPYPRSCGEGGTFNPTDECSSRPLPPRAAATNTFRGCVWPPAARGHEFAHTRVCMSVTRLVTDTGRGERVCTRVQRADTNCTDLCCPTESRRCGVLAFLKCAPFQTKLSQRPSGVSRRQCYRVCVLAGASAFNLTSRCSVHAIAETVADAPSPTYLYPIQPNLGWPTLFIGRASSVDDGQVLLDAARPGVALVGSIWDCGRRRRAHRSGDTQ
jgi:hypothetical protein